MPASRIFRDVTATVGNTPLIELTRLTRNIPARVVYLPPGRVGQPFPGLRRPGLRPVPRVAPRRLHDAVRAGRIAGDATIGVVLPAPASVRVRLVAPLFVRSTLPEAVNVAPPVMLFVIVRLPL